MPPTHLTIDYVLDGENRGYAFTTRTDHLDLRVVKAVWRYAMPRGQGWGDYLMAHSLKAIPLENGQIALSEITVTDQSDEIGRQGLRRAEVTVLPARDYEADLRAHWEALPAARRQAAERKLGWRLRSWLAMPKMRDNAQLIISHPYTSPDAWQVVEGLLLKLALARPGLVREGGFTTLALDHREESRLIAMPSQKAAQIKSGKGVSIIDIS